jgi:hypothetical protein
VLAPIVVNSVDETLDAVLAPAAVVMTDRTHAQISFTTYPSASILVGHS